MTRAEGWVAHAIWWQVYPLGFTGAPAALTPGPARHRLRQLTGWLDYAVALGCSGLQLGPIFTSGTHGYDTVDHFRIDPRLGDEADFDALVAAARRRGLRIVLDGVFNHVGHGFAAPPGWLRRRADGSVETFEGHGGLLALDHSEPGVADHVAAVMGHWLERGAAGWRLDAAYAVPPEFWAPVLARVRAAHPGAWFAGEMIHGDYAGYVARSGLDSVTQYELWKAIWSSLNDGNFHELAWALARHGEMLESFTPLTFVGNHDVTRLASRLDDRRHLGHALAVLFTVGGVPSVYYGDERGLTAVKEERAGGDDAIRPVFPSAPYDLPAAEAAVFRLHQDLIGLRRRHPWLVHARTTPEHLTNRTAALRSRHGDHSLLLLLNTGDTPFHHADTTVPPHAWAIVTATEILTSR